MKKNGFEIEMYIDGKGPTFVILPSYGCDSGEDFASPALFPEQPAIASS